ncbi:hypothetical protein [Noviherbaspirillum malthae]|uniref:hypothetical protein n=1 Tax=Noviherbaspirillum malthae TaxID=1260987 RepID=UPI00189099F3|nr:hypothetical protein [Noviherbaspirillum malthae]
MTNMLKKSPPSESGRDRASHPAWAHHGAEPCSDDTGQGGSAIKISMDELFMLQGCPHNAIVFYLQLRTKMDFRTGKVGVGKYGVSWGRMAALLRVQSHPGIRQISMTNDVVRGCAERLEQRGLLRSETQGRRLGFMLPMALTDRETQHGVTREAFRISAVEIDRLTGVPHGVIVLYLHLRALMRLQDGSVGIHEKVSWNYLRDLLRVEAVRGRRAKAFSVDQVRRMAQRLRKLQLIDLRSEGRQLIFMLPLAHAHFHDSQKAASTPTGKAAKTPRAKKPDAVSETDRYIEEQRQAESKKSTKFPASGFIVNTSLSPATTAINGDSHPVTPEETTSLKFADWINATDRRTLIALMSDLSTAQQQVVIDKFQGDMGSGIKSVSGFFQSVLRNFRAGTQDLLSSRPPVSSGQGRQAADPPSQQAMERARETALLLQQHHQSAEDQLAANLALAGRRLSLQEALKIPWSEVDPEFAKKRATACEKHGRKVGTKP